MNIPLPFRVAAGVVAAGLEQLRKLPEELPGLPVALAGGAVRASLRVQQTLAELATKGDELLAPWAGGAVENPSWARFDDDDEAPAEDAAAGGADGAGDDDPADTPAAPPKRGPAPRKTTTPRVDKGAPAADAPAEDDYDSLTLAQLRATLKTLGSAEVEALLTREEQGRARAPFLTVLGNRLISVRADESGRS